MKKNESVCLLQALSCLIVFSINMVNDCFIQRWLQLLCTWYEQVEPFLEAARTFGSAKSRICPGWTLCLQVWIYPFTFLSTTWGAYFCSVTKVSYEIFIPCENGIHSVLKYSRFLCNTLRSEFTNYPNYCWVTFNLGLKTPIEN